MVRAYHKTLNYKGTAERRVFGSLLMCMNRRFKKTSAINKPAYSRIREAGHCLPEIPSRAAGKELKSTEFLHGGEGYVFL
jgi:hypothetical protein